MKSCEMCHPWCYLQCHPYLVCILPDVIPPSLCCSQCHYYHPWCHPCSLNNLGNDIRDDNKNCAQSLFASLFLVWLISSEADAGIKKLNQMHFFLGQNGVYVETKYLEWNYILGWTIWAVIYDKYTFKLSAQSHPYGAPGILCEQGKFLTEITLQTHIGP